MEDIIKEIISFVKASCPVGLSTETIFVYNESLSIFLDNSKFLTLKDFIKKYYTGKNKVKVEDEFYILSYSNRERIAFISKDLWARYTNGELRDCVFVLDPIFTEVKLAA